MKNKSLDKDHKPASAWLAEQNRNIKTNISDSEIIIKNFFDAVNSKTDIKPTGNITSLSRMVQSVTELEQDGILEKNEAKVLLEFVVQKFIESKFDKFLEGLQIDNDYRLFVASSNYFKN